MSDGSVPVPSTAILPMDSMWTRHHCPQAMADVIWPHPASKPTHQASPGPAQLGSWSKGRCIIAWNGSKGTCICISAVTERAGYSEP